MSQVIEHTRDFTVHQHQESPMLYELVDDSKEPPIGIFFTGVDAFKFSDMLKKPLGPAETMNKRLRRIYQQARHSIDRGIFADKL